MIASPKDVAAGRKLQHVLVQRYAAHYGIDVFGKVCAPLDDKVYAFSAHLLGRARCYAALRPRGTIKFSGEDDFEDALRRVTPEFYL